MILVDHGFTMSEHAPTTYNYQFQTVPSAIVRTLDFPLDQIDPPAADTDTGFPVFFTSQISTGAGTLGGLGRQAIDCYFSRRSGNGSGKHQQIQSIPAPSGGYEIREIYDDSLIGDINVYSETPILFAFVAEKIGAGALSSTIGFTADSAQYAYQYTFEGVQYVAYRYMHWGDSSYNSIRLAQTGALAQTDYLYTVTGGAV